MSTVGAVSGSPASAELSPYERGQIKAIAAWKAKGSSPVKRLLRAVAKPLGNLSERVLPKKIVATAIDGVNRMAAQLAVDDSILKDKAVREMGVESLEDIAAKPLEFADKIADHIIGDASRIAFGMGIATGTGGPVVAIAEIPVLIAGALRVIHRVCQAYGYAVDRERDRLMMLGILALSTASDPRERAEAMRDYQRQIETSFLHQAVDESAKKALQRIVLGVELGAMIPGFGLAINAVAAREYVVNAGETAKRVFQERWLRERGKVTWIEPVSLSH